jgi:hypothetical protein
MLKSRYVVNRRRFHWRTSVPGVSTKGYHIGTLSLGGQLPGGPWPHRKSQVPERAAFVLVVPAGKLGRMRWWKIAVNLYVPLLSEPRGLPYLMMVSGVSTEGACQLCEPESVVIPAPGKPVSTPPEPTEAPQPQQALQPSPEASPPGGPRVSNSALGRKAAACAMSSCPGRW